MLYTINVHFSSKSGSSSTQGEARPPVNGVVDQRAKQVKVSAVRAFACVRFWAGAELVAGFHQLYPRFGQGREHRCRGRFQRVYADEECLCSVRRHPDRD